MKTPELYEAEIEALMNMNLKLQALLTTALEALAGKARDLK